MSRDASLIAITAKAFAALAAVGGVFAFGYLLGNRDVDAAQGSLALAMERAALLSDRPEVRDAFEAARNAAIQGDIAGAIEALPSNVRSVRQADCYDAGTAFAATAGALVRNCETGMIATVASVNANGNVITTLGGQRTGGTPGQAFAHPDARFAGCHLIYMNLDPGAQTPTARMNFDCPKGETQ